MLIYLLINISKRDESLLRGNQDDDHFTLVSHSRENNKLWMNEVQECN